MNFADMLGPGATAAGMAFGGPPGAILGGLAGGFLGDLFGGGSEEQAAKEHQRKLQELAERIQQDRKRQMAGRIAMTQNAGQAFAPANQMISNMSGGRVQPINMGQVFADPTQGLPEQAAPRPNPAQTPAGRQVLHQAGESAKSKLPFGSFLPNPF